MLKPSLRKLIIPLLFLGLAWSGWAFAADPPSRVARLSYVTGAASFSPGGERDWGRAIVNRPLVTGDRLWVERGARAELQLGAAAIRVGGGTSLTLLNLDDRIAQLQLDQGTLNIRVRVLDRRQVFEVATPNLAFSIRRPGSYRIHVDPDGGATTVTVRTGMAEIYGEGRAFIARERQTLRFYDSGLRDYQSFATWPTDEFDRWASERDRRWDNSPSRRYVSAEMIGYEDLDQHGTWRKHPDYGSVWVPRRVAADWAPYRDGHWAWVEPWGWTWVDEAPWGFAPSHYGRWAHIDGAWAWVPGPAKARPVYAPALVAFVAGSNLQAAGGGAVGWFPLGPSDVYRPSYTASREYFTNVNTSNTVITQVNVTNVYNNTNVTNVTYANQQVPGAVVAMLAAAFVQSRPVARETVRVNREVVARAPVAAVAPVAPVQASVVGPAAAPSAQPPERTRSRPVVAQTAPPPPPVPFAAKQSALAANAGKPLDTAAVAALKPAAPVSAPAVKVVPATQPVAAPEKPASAPAPAASQAAAPVAAPPAAAASPAREMRRQRADEERGRGQQPAAPSAPEAARPAAQTAAPAPAPAVPVPAAPVPAAPAARAPAAAAPAMPQATAPAAPVAAPPAPEASSAREMRRQRADEERGRRQQPAAPSAPEAARPAAPAAPAAAPAPATAPAPEAQRPPPPGPPAAQPRPPVAVPPPAASAPPAPAAAPPATPAARAAAPASAASEEQRGRRARSDDERASGRREAASGAKSADERRRKREEEEQGRKP